MSYTIEPFYIAQTAEPEHMTAEGAERWIRSQVEDVKARAGSPELFPRLSFNEDPKALLLEIWDQNPGFDGYGDQRWSFTGEPPK